MEGAKPKWIYYGEGRWDATIELMKRGAHAVGIRIPSKWIYYLDALVDYLTVGQWMASHSFDTPVRVSSRFAVFQQALSEIAERSVLYLEFGVFEGRTMRFWSEALRNPASHLHGFDSFEGLPENWSAALGKGAFSVEGAVPQFPDPRVTFYKGWFEETLPAYEPPEHDVLFVNVDCDLYSSTRTVLGYVVHLLRPGSYLYFDEIHHRGHEMRAFEEIMEQPGWTFSLVATNRSCCHALFRVEAQPEALQAAATLGGLRLVRG
jgi:hypothetical protein